MTEAPQTANFFANGATIYSRGKKSNLSKIVKALGIAAATIAVVPSVTENNVSPKSMIADIDAASEINRIIDLRRLNGVPKIPFSDKISAASFTVQTIPASNVDVNTIMYSLTRQRLDEVNAENVYHQYGDYKVPHTVLKELVRAAKDADFPTDYLFGIVEKESHFDCNAKPPSGSARGCMQVIDQTWLRLVKEYGDKYGLSKEAGLVELTYNKRKQPVYRVGDKKEAQRILDLRYDVYYAATLAVTDLKAAKSKIEKNLSIKFDDDNLYLPHFMGEDRAQAALAAYEKRPNATASKIFNREARANPGMFYNGKGRRRVPIDVAGFIKRAQNVILSRSMKYNDVKLIAQKSSLDFVLAENVPVPVVKPSLSKDSFISAMKSRISSRKLPLFPKGDITSTRPFLEANSVVSERNGPRI